MNDLKSFIDNLGIEVFETGLNLAGLAIVSDSGDLIIQTENWNLKKDTNSILKVLNGERLLELSGGKYLVVDTSANGIITTSDSAMGFVLLVPFQGGVLVAYAMPQADTSKALEFLKNKGTQLDRKI